jgi:hypothetical protein
LSIRKSAIAAIGAFPDSTSQRAWSKIRAHKKEGDLEMSFIFRTVFWLSLAIVLIPPEVRLGGGETADFDAVDLGREIGHAGTALWSLGAAALDTCETNPGLCKATADLWATTLRTGGALAADAQNQLEKSALPAIAPAGDEPRPKPKIQARVE